MQLVISAIGADRPEIIGELTKTIRECRCGILESRMSELGTEFAGYFLVEGNWNHIARLESAAEALGHRFGLKVVAHRASEAEKPADNSIPYTVDVFASDRLDNISELVAFFAGRNIKVLDFSSSRYPAPYNGSPLFLAHLIVTIPAGIRIVSLRDEFLEFCDQQNLDAILEPIKR